MSDIKSIDKWIAERTGFGENLSQSNMKQYQLKKLRQIMGYAQEHSPFYRKLYENIDISSLNSIDDLEGLPLIGSEDIVLQGNQMVCLDRSQIKRIVTLTSSGSTAAPKRVFFSADDLELTVDFFANGMATMTGEGERVMICMPCDKPDGIGDLLARGLERIGAKPYRYGAIFDYNDAAAVMQKLVPDCLVGIPGQIMRLAVHTPQMRPAVVLLSADFIPDAIRVRLADIWHCEVYAHYGMTESGLGGGVECGAHSGYHLRHADLLFEIIDPVTGKQKPDGQRGEVVFTTLNRRAMPLIRYRIGDISRIIANPCPCGSNLERLGKVDGRYANIINLGEDKTISINQLDEILYLRPEVMDYTASLANARGEWTLSVEALLVKGASLTDVERYLKYNLDMQIKLNCGGGFTTNGTIKRQLKLNISEGKI